MTAALGPDRNSLRSAIVREIEHTASEAGAKAIAGAMPLADVERIKALQCVLNALPEKAIIPAQLAALIGVVCLLAASFALAIRVPWTRLELDLTTTSVAMHIDNDFSWHGVWHVEASKVRLQNFTRIELPPEYGQRTETSLELNGAKGSIRVDDLFFGHGTALTIATNEIGAADIVATGAPFRGDMEISGEVNGHTGQSLNKSLPLQEFDSDMPPGRFAFTYDGEARGQQPPFIHGSPAETLALSDMGVTTLNFDEENPKPGLPEEITFTSQITSGTITITDSGEQITLGPAATLRLTDVRGRIANLQLTARGVHVKFEGTASDVKLGTGDFARNLKPTILEWLFHQQKLGLFWGALTFLWGIFWSARRLVSGVA